jgi:hypothetical protein
MRILLDFRTFFVHRKANEIHLQCSLQQQMTHRTQTRTLRTLCSNSSFGALRLRSRVPMSRSACVVRKLKAFEFIFLRDTHSCTSRSFALPIPTMADDPIEDEVIKNTGPDFLYARTMDQITHFLQGA